MATTIANVSGNVCVCNYHSVEDKLYFSNNATFFIDLKNQPSYEDVEETTKRAVFEQKTNWGLGYNLGFSKNFVFSKNGPVKYNYNNDNIVADNNKYVASENPLILENQPIVYMDIDKLNHMDEIIPCSDRTRGGYNDNSSYKNEGTFAKINLNNESMSNFSKKAKDMFFSDTPLKSLDRLHIRLRHHDGRMIDLKNKEYTMVLEINTLRDKPNNHKTITVPDFYPL